MHNQSMMSHPMHLHSHTFAVATSAGPGVRKDTVNVLPTKSLSVDVTADTPGLQTAHCHNAYHGAL
ncbi:MAG: multicopper oxidase domain-containing protein, partial [Mycobacteriaceae bacterium]